MVYFVLGLSSVGLCLSVAITGHLLLTGAVCVLVLKVIDTVPSMMNALRMVWIISRHYNRDDRMVPLMAMIAWELAERVQRVVTFRSLFE